MNLVKILPMAVVMIAGPQILSAIFLATSERWKSNSAAYVAGAALSITLTVSLAYFLIDGAVGGGGSSDTVSIIILALLTLAALRVYMTRETAEPPKFMGRLQAADPKLSFRLGFLLLGIFPTDILTSAAVGTYLANEGDPWWHLLPFLLLTLLLLALPALLLVAFGERAQAFLPKARNWMNDNSWVVSELVIALFVALTISNLAS